MQIQNADECECNMEIDRLSVETVYSLFAAIFGVNVIRLEVNETHRKVVKQFFGGSGCLSRKNILEWSIFGVKFEKTLSKLQTKLKKREKNMDFQNYQKVLRLKETVHRLKNLQNKPENKKFYLCSLQGQNQILKSHDSNQKSKSNLSKKFKCEINKRF